MAENEADDFIVPNVQHFLHAYFLSSPIGGASTSYFKNFCPRPRPRSCLCVIWIFRTITLESLNQSEPNFHT